MTNACTSIGDLSDDQLLAEAKRLAGVERCATAALVRSLAELDARRLYLGEGCSSLFTYCTQVLRLAEGAAYNRIEAARAARRFPCIFDGLADGSLTLTTVRLLAPHLTPENHLDVLASARHNSKREVELLIVSLHPKPAVTPTIRKLPSVRHVDQGAAAEGDVSAARSASLEGTTGTPRTRAAEVADAPTVATPTPRAVVAPLAPQRFKVQFTISKETHEKLRRVQDLARHSIPNGDLAAIFDRGLTLLLNELERRRFAATSSPRSPRTESANSRHVPAAVRREVWQRDEGRCAFVGKSGRCTERTFLEFHHVEPYADGGTATVDNIQLRCRAHNAYEASLFFGTDLPAYVREERPPWPPFAGTAAELFRNELAAVARIVGTK